MTEDTQFGPKMRLLNDRQRAFVIAFVEGGSLNQQKAYTDAGYTTTHERSTEACASRLANTQKVQDAILEETGRRLKAHAPMALSSLLVLVKNPTSKDHFAATKHLLDVAGFTPKQQVDVTHSGTVDMSFAEIRAQIETLRRAGLQQLPSPVTIDMEPAE